MSAKKGAERLAFQRVPETCPAVDAAFADIDRAVSDALAAMDGIGLDAALGVARDQINAAAMLAMVAVKAQTCALRDALIGALAEASEARSSLDGVIKSELAAPLKALRYALRWVDPSTGNKEWSQLMDAAEEMAAAIERVTW